MHFCADEAAALLLLVPGARYVLTWFRDVWKRRHEKPVCTHDHEHKDK